MPLRPLRKPTDASGQPCRKAARRGGLVVSGEGAMIGSSEATPASEATRTSTPRRASTRKGSWRGSWEPPTIAVWFLILDSLAGRPFRTPTILGTAIFRSGQGLTSAEGVAVSFEMVVLYTWVHALVFWVIAGVAARLLRVAERQPNAGFGILLLFVVFEFGFVATALLFAEPVLHALTWPAILVRVSSPRW